MAKAPVLGTVKSRLARDIGWVPATAFHRNSVQCLTKRLAMPGRWQSIIAIAPDVWRAMAFPKVRGIMRIGQGNGDLGMRLQRVMDRLPPGPVVIVGTDIPEIRPHDIAEAFRLLGGRSAVLGPGADGGYWLVGLRRTPRIPAIFKDVRWSSQHTLADTHANTGRDTAFTAQLEDVDDLGSYRRRAGAAKRVVLPPLQNR